METTVLDLEKFLKKKNPANRFTVRKWKYSHLKNIEVYIDTQDITAEVYKSIIKSIRGHRVFNYTII